MSLYSELKLQVADIVQEALSEFTDPIVLYANSSASEPSQSYCSISRMSLRQTGRPQYSGLDEDLVAETAIPYELTVSVNFIGKDSPEMAFSSHARIGTSYLNRQFSQQYNLSVKNKSRATPTPYFRNNKYIDVYSYDVTFTLLWGIREVIDPIEQVIIENIDSAEIITIPPTI